MRKLSLVLSFLVTAVLATLAFNYAAALAGERRTVVQESWLEESEPMAYQSYGEGGGR
jgi:hypothetical protein